MCHLCDATEADFASFAMALARSRASAWAASAARSAWLSVRPVRFDSDRAPPRLGLLRHHRPEDGVAKGRVARAAAVPPAALVRAEAVEQNRVLMRAAPRSRSKREVGGLQRGACLRRTRLSWCRSMGASSFVLAAGCCPSCGPYRPAKAEGMERREARTTVTRAAGSIAGPSRRRRGRLRTAARLSALHRGICRRTLHGAPPSAPGRVS